ncbi:MAG: galactose mutarotase [Candidatus Acidiferrum sp.]
MKKLPFGKLEDGRAATLYVLTNKHGVEVSISDFGGIVVGIKVPDRHGKIEDVALGYDSVDGYATTASYFGGTIGRYGNRIAHGEFSLNGTKYTLAKNDHENHLHGGIKGFNKVLWTVKNTSTKDGASLHLSYLSKDGEEGYPGNLTTDVTFTLTDANELRIDYLATTDKDTVVNLTNHSYFNLAGGGNILDHQLMLAASRFTPVDAGLIPIGELRSVEGTPFDFRKATAVGARIGQDDEQLKRGKGYDHNWVLDSTGGSLALAATLYEPKSGRFMEVWTTEPGVQFYSGNFLDGTAKGKHGKAYELRSALCLETQHFPDSPNHPDFPTTTLKAGAKYQTSSVYKFSTK